MWCVSKPRRYSSHKASARPVPPRLALVHYFAGQNAVQFKNVVVADALLRRVLFHVAKAGEVIDDLAPSPLPGGGQRAPFLQRPHLLQRERIALDGGGGMDVAGTRVFLQGRNPRHLDSRAENPLAQRGHGLDLREQAWGNGEVGLIRHSISKL